MTVTHALEPHRPGLRGHGDTHGQGTWRSYLTGFVLSVILTAIPFWLVMGKVLQDTQSTALLVFGFALVQIVVHVTYFLHLDTRAVGGCELGGGFWVLTPLRTEAG